MPKFLVDGKEMEISVADAKSYKELGSEVQPIGAPVGDDPTAPNEADQILADIKAGKVRSLPNEKAKLALRRRREKFPNDFVVNGVFTADETDTAKIVPNPENGDIVRTKPGSRYSKSGTGFFVMFQSTKKVVNGKPAQYGISLNDESEVDNMKPEQIFDTVCIAIDENAKRPLLVMNFDN